MLCGLLARIQPVRILVVGDLMLDAYTHGKIERISPEAPVSILRVKNESSQPGGAGNVAINLRALGANVVLLGRVGRDLHGEALIKQLEQEAIDVDHLLYQEGYTTPVKNRLIAEAQQLLRIDREETIALTEAQEQVVLSACEKCIEQVDLVAISDYAKGFLTPNLIQGIIGVAKRAGRIVVADPKGEDFAKYQGASVLKPNLREAYTAAKQSLQAPIDLVASTLLARSGVDTLLITLGGDGMSLFQKGRKRLDFPVLSREVKDVTGAGDTVLATICLALANQLDIAQAAQLGNTAASIAIEHVGCAKIGLEDLAKRLLEQSTDNKIFNEEHLFALGNVVQNKHCILLRLRAGDGVTNALFRCVRKLSHFGGIVIAYICDPHPDPEYIAFLSSLSGIHFIVLKGLDVKNLLQAIIPQSLFALEKEELISITHPEQFFI